jgi:tRNA1(Val) A37 N6-methylase TrmN6
MADAVPEPASTLDAFHRGAFWLVQPKGAGHRAGMDAMMLAAAVPSGFAGRLADLGAGAGAAGLAVVARCAGARVVLVENAPEMLRFAKATIAHEANRHLRERVSVMEGDASLSGKARAAAGLQDGAFDYAIMNPPFNAGHDRPTPDTLKRDAHVMPEGLFESWLRSAAAIVKPRGGVAIIARPQSIAQILAALTGRFGKVEVLPVHPRPDGPAIRIVVRGVRASRAGMALMPPLFLHEAGGDRFSERADAINNGRTSLFGD